MTYVDPLMQIARGQQYVDNLFQGQAQRQAGRRLQQNDYRGAASALYETGDLAGGQAVAGAGQEQDARQKSEQLAFTLQASRALRAARQGGQDILSAYDQYVPVFEQMGATPEQVQQFRAQLSTNPDAFLDSVDQIVGQQQRELEFRNAGQDVLVLDKGNGQEVARYRQSPQDYTLGDARFSGETNAPIAQAPRDPEIIQRDPTKDLIEIPGSPAMGGASGQPRGIRNNNPGNIEDGAFARSLPGYAGSDGRFAIFSTPEAGAQAAPRLLQSYISRGFDTPAEIINRWAPPSDNNPTQAYAGYVAQRLGIGPNDQVRPEQILQLAQAISEFENGNRPPSNGGSSNPRVLAAAAPTPGVAVLSAQEVEGLGLPEGTVAQRRPDGSISVVSRGGERFTEGQRLSASFYHRALGAERNLNRLSANGGRPSAAVLAFGEGRLRENALSPADRQWVQASRDWLAPILRRDTGAAVSPGELVTYMGTYIPNPTDDPATLAQKAESRRRAQEGLRGTAGGAYEDLLRTLGGGNSSRPRTNAPGLPFDASEAQLRTRQQLVLQGATPSAPVGSIRNPRYMNPQDPASSWNNARSGDYVVRPDGRVVRKP